ncbi:phage tail protein [Nocardioides sp.]|uniref:phage tail protein n=1 Tax=Nocardioides sp. TaxID=35761 RepID=UPI00356B45A2
MNALARGADQLPDVRRAKRADDWMINQLPLSMLSHDFFVRYVRIFQTLGSTLLEDADNIEHVVDLSIAPPELVRWLGSWIGVDSLDESMPDALRRRIVGSAASTLTWRGTTRGLRSYLELISGSEVEVEEGGGIWRDSEAPEDTAWVVMRVASTGLLELAAFVDTVRDEVPAHVRAELYVADECVWRSGEEQG